jgi:hypothetical protein
VGSHYNPSVQSTEARKEKKAMAKQKATAITYVGYAFSALAFLIFVYTFFFVSEDNLRAQAIYYFLVSLVAAALPQIEQLKYNDLEVHFRQEIQTVRDRIQEIDERVTKLFLITMSPAMYFNLEKLADGTFKHFRKTAGFERELYHLRDIGYVKIESIKAIPKEGPDITEYVTIKEAGKEFVQLRRAMEKEEPDL